MARIWVPAVRCPDCSYPNDASFAFCQQCGYVRRKESGIPDSEKVRLDLPAIDDRLEALRKIKSDKPYQKQKSSLQREFERFLRSLPSPKSLMSAAPQDITRFLIWKDQGGKTKVHLPQCRHFGVSGKARCPCPTRLAAGTVDNVIGKLRSIFIEAGRGDVWNDILGVGNPAAHHSVKQYLILMREEQAKARVCPKQAIPIFFEKMTKLCLYLRGFVFSKNTSAVQRYLYARDLAFFCLDFYSGDRGSDLGRIFTKEIVCLSDGDGFLFRHTFGKTLRGGGKNNTFMIKKCPDPKTCPVANLKLYVNLCDLMCVNLRDGYLFRVLNSKNEISADPFVGSAVANRLTLHLRSAGIYNGETMHSFRSGCSITLSLLGVPSEDVARHVGWSSVITANYYSQTGRVMNSDTVATSLALSTAPSPGGGAPLASVVSQAFSEKNEMRNLSLAFP